MARFNYLWLSWLNILVCRVMYYVTPPSLPPLPQTGPLIVVANHDSLSDPLVLLATAGRPIEFLMDQDIYNQVMFRWVYRAFRCIPVRRGSRDIRAVRAMVRILKSGRVVGLFPEGGIDQFRSEEGYAGVGYLALKTGSPVVPVGIIWEKKRPLTILASLLTPAKATVCYGKPIPVSQESHPRREQIEALTARIMDQIKTLSNQQTGNRSSSTSFQTG